MGFVVTAVSQFQKARGADFNAEASEKEAEAVRKQARVAAQDQRDKDARIIATGIARAGASGVATDSGSTMEVIAENERRGEENAMRILEQGAIDSAALQNQAKLDRFQRDNLNLAGLLTHGFGAVEATKKSGSGGGGKGGSGKGGSGKSGSGGSGKSGSGSGGGGK